MPPKEIKKQTQPKFDENENNIEKLKEFVAWLKMNKKFKDKKALKVIDNYEEKANELKNSNPKEAIDFIDQALWLLTQVRFPNKFKERMEKFHDLRTDIVLSMEQKSAAAAVVKPEPKNGECKSTSETKVQQSSVELPPVELIKLLSEPLGVLDKFQDSQFKPFGSAALNIIDDLVAKIQENTVGDLLIKQQYLLRMQYINGRAKDKNAEGMNAVINNYLGYINNKIALSTGQQAQKATTLAVETKDEKRVIREEDFRNLPLEKMENFKLPVEASKKTECIIWMKKIAYNAYDEEDVDKAIAYLKKIQILLRQEADKNNVLEIIGEEIVGLQNSKTTGIRYLALDEICQYDYDYLKSFPRWCLQKNGSKSLGLHLEVEKVLSKLEDRIDCMRKLVHLNQAVGQTRNAKINYTHLQSLLALQQQQQQQLQYQLQLQQQQLALQMQNFAGTTAGYLTYQQGYYAPGADHAGAMTFLGAPSQSYTGPASVGAGAGGAGAYFETDAGGAQTYSEVDAAPSLTGPG